MSADGTTCVSGCENGKYSVPTTNECQNCPVGTFNTDGLLLGVRPAHLVILVKKKDFQFVLHAETRLDALSVWGKN